jgi:hypothetical protein
MTAIQVVSIAPRQQKGAQPVDLRMGDDRLHPPLAEALSPVWSEHKRIAQPGECSIIRDHPSKAHLA